MRGTAGSGSAASGGIVASEYLYNRNGERVTTVDNADMLVRSVLRAGGLHWGDFIGDSETRQLSFVLGKSKASYEIVALKPFLDVEPDHRSDPGGGVAPSIGKGFLWGMTISADSDYDISFDKK